MEKTSKRVEEFKEKVFYKILNVEEMSKKHSNFQEIAYKLFHKGEVRIPKDEELAVYLKKFSFIEIDKDNKSGNLLLSMSMENYLESSIYNKVKKARMDYIKNKLNDLIVLQDRLIEEYLQLA